MTGEFELDIDDETPGTELDDMDFELDIDDAQDDEGGEDDDE